MPKQFFLGTSFGVNKKIRGNSPRVYEPGGTAAKPTRPRSYWSASDQQQTAAKFISVKSPSRRRYAEKNARKRSWRRRKNAKKFTSALVCLSFPAQEVLQTNTRPKASHLSRWKSGGVGHAGRVREQTRIQMAIGPLWKDTDRGHRAQFQAQGSKSVTIQRSVQSDHTVANSGPEAALDLSEQEQRCRTRAVVGGQKGRRRPSRCVNSRQVRRGLYRCARHLSDGVFSASVRHRCRARDTRARPLSSGEAAHIFIIATVRKKTRFEFSDKREQKPVLVAADISDVTKARAHKGRGDDQPSTDECR